MKIRPTIFNVSLLLTPLLMQIAYWERGYFAFGGETLVPMFGLLLHYFFKGQKKEKRYE